MSKSSNAVKRPDTELGVGPSLFLDLLRLSAALMVTLGHLSQPEFSRGWPNLIDYAVNSVTTFFLLSGFVIRYITVRRRSTLQSYAADRASRIYSVVLPAGLFAAFADIALRRMNHLPSLRSPAYLHQFLLGIAANLTFTSFIWHHQIGFPSDGPMWSLAFEWFYYMIYGVAFYLCGWRRALSLLFVCLLAGPEILTLLPVWLGGCLLFECFIRVRHLRWFLIACILAPIAALGLMLNAQFRHHVETARTHFADIMHSLQSQGQSSTSSFVFLLPHLGLGSNVSLNAYFFGAIFFVGMLLGLLLFDQFDIDHNGRTARSIRLLAEATFPLYLFHLPILLLTVAILGHQLYSEGAKLLFFFSIFALSVLLGQLLNRFKLVLRGWFFALFSNKPPAVAAAK